MVGSFAIHNHQGKGSGLLGSLITCGWQMTDHNPDVLLIDYAETPYYRQIIDTVNAKKIVLYQHGAESFTVYDGIVEPNPKVDAMLVQSRGAKECLRLMGYPKPVHVTGWYWTPVNHVEPLDHPVHNILFAPLHPLNDGRLCAWKKEANHTALACILKANLPVTVRAMGEIKNNGIEDLVDNLLVRVVPADKETMLSDMESHSVVVSSGTFAHCAVAVGKPVIMYGQKYTPTDDDGKIEAAKFDEYRHLLDYPYSIEDDNDNIRLIIDHAINACFSMLWINWHNRWIGEQVDIFKVGEIMEGIINANV